MVFLLKGFARHFRILCEIIVLPMCGECVGIYKSYMFPICFESCCFPWILNNVGIYCCNNKAAKYPELDIDKNKYTEHPPDDLGEGHLSFATCNDIPPSKDQGLL